MNQLMLRALSPVLTTASVLLISVAITMADGGNSCCAPPVCPAEQQAGGGGCTGTCMTTGDTCQETTTKGPDGKDRATCDCLP